MTAPDPHRTVDLSHGPAQAIAYVLFFFAVVAVVAFVCLLIVIAWPG